MLFLQICTRILTLPYETRDGWDLNVMQMNNTLYFEEHVNDEKLQEKFDYLLRAIETD